MRAKVAKKTGPSLAAAKHLRALFESHAVRQMAHDARLDLQKRIQDHNFVIQQRMDAHRLRVMRADTPRPCGAGHGRASGRDPAAEPHASARPAADPHAPPAANPHAARAGHHASHAQCAPPALRPDPATRTQRQEEPDPPTADLICVYIKR